MKRFILALMFVVLASSAVYAQTPSVEVGKTFGVAATHDGVLTVTYEALVDGAVVASLPVSALAGGEITFTGLVAPARGAHVLQVRARNEDQSADSDPLAFNTVKGKPNKPGRPRIVSGLIAVLRAPAKLFGFLKPRSEFGTVRLILEG